MTVTVANKYTLMRALGDGEFQNLLSVFDYFSFIDINKQLIDTSLVLQDEVVLLVASFLTILLEPLTGR